MRHRYLQGSVSAAAAVAQTSDNVRIDLRLVAQRGAPGDAGGVVDIPGDHDPITAPGQVRRFEVQYRLVDTHLTDSVVPAGLTICDLRIRAGIDPSLGHLLRASLSSFEASQAGATPPGPIDLSGPAIGGQTGLHLPLRDGLPPSLGDVSSRNGVFSSDGLVIDSIEPLAIFQTNQNAPGGADGLGAWYGLYSFNFVAGAGQGQVRLTVETLVDVGTGNHFGFFADGFPVPWTSRSGGSASIGLTIIPAPAAISLLMLGFGLVRRRR